MPVRSLSSPVFKWPDRDEVEKTLRRWAQQMKQRDPRVVKIGYFGSYARGDWGFGSDLDIVIVVRTSVEDFFHRSVDFDTSSIPVPVDLLVYTEEEFEKLLNEGWNATKETVWVC